jgi:hypothetical protein
MNFMKRFVTGLGNQTAPFGFSPNDPEAGYKAGLGYIGDVGANLLANNQGGVDPFANLGMSIQQAKASGTQRNREQYTAQRLMEEAEAKKQERDAAEAERMQREEFLKTLPPDVQMKARSVPGFLEEYVKATDPAFQTAQQPATDQYFGTPIPFDMGDGRIGYGLPSKTGGFRPLEIPGGGSFLSPFDKAYQTGAGGVQGKMDVEKTAAAPSDLQAAEMALGILDQITSHPALEAGTGFTSYGNLVRGTPGYDFQNIVEQAKSGAFLTAIDQLRGMGALSNMEGQTATAAVTRMDTATSKEAFLKAVEDYRSIINNARDRAMARMNQSGSVPVPGPGADNDPLGLR